MGGTGVFFEKMKMGKVTKDAVKCLGSEQEDENYLSIPTDGLIALDSSD